jgi:ParB-like chromosome segregation protein Spo0J
MTDSRYQLYRDLDEATATALRASIARFGVLVPVVIDQHGNVIDGHQRARIASELGVDYRTEQRTVADGDEGRELARTLNEDRRALPKNERLAVVRALREDGHSTRAIAGAVGVSHTQVKRDLAGGTSVPPRRVTGADGKSYPAQVRSIAAKDEDEDRPTPQAHFDALVELINKLIERVLPSIDFAQVVASREKLRALDLDGFILGCVVDALDTDHLRDTPTEEEARRYREWHRWRLARIDTEPIEAS